jgi:nucleotide-binding universal stress UspA family protein
MAMTPSLLERLARKKPVDRLVADSQGSGDAHGSLGRSIALFQLFMFGVGATIGTGIFFVLSQKVPTGGPAVVISFIIAGPLGRFVEGSVTTDVLRSAHLPVAVAPRGYTVDARTLVRRVCCAFSGSSTSASLARRSADLAQLLGVPPRLTTLVVRDKQMCPTGAVYDAQNIVSNAPREQVLEALTVLIEHWESPVSLCGEIGDGNTLKAAFDSLLWANTELLVVRSSSLGPLLGVFLGSNSSKMAHNSPMPCLIMPRVED